MRDPLRKQLEGCKRNMLFQFLSALLVSAAVVQAAEASFEFAGLSYAQREDNRDAYKLEGFEEELYPSGT